MMLTKHKLKRNPNAALGVEGLARTESPLPSPSPSPALSPPQVPSQALAQVSAYFHA
jgi:hypothetical protein